MFLQQELDHDVAAVDPTRRSKLVETLGEQLFERITGMADIPAVQGFFAGADLVNAGFDGAHLISSQDLPTTRRREHEAATAAGADTFLIVR